MLIKGKVHCLFEQSGTFKNEFIKLGYEAYDYDIQNEFEQTDFQLDLFNHINYAYLHQDSIFDKFIPDDLLIAFFPCIHFESMAMMYYDLSNRNLTSFSKLHKYSTVIDKILERERFYLLLWKLYAICDIRNLRLIIENPATLPHYLLSFQNFPQPTFIDNNRMYRGDYFVKPTAYWFVNCYPEAGYFSYQYDKDKKTICRTASSPVPGICSAQRSMISPDYARNFICDFILGVKQSLTIPTLFEL